MKKQEVIAKLQSLANPVNVAGMARYGINPKNTLGISIPILRDITKEIGTDDALADELWASGIHFIRSRSARWVAADALRELTSEKAQGRLRD